ncbi:MAG: SPOR domain-containing protein [Nitrospinae bacterium]|nr:SPOR domain-containing protein [Nitrospinota bacterium]
MLFQTLKFYLARIAVSLVLIFGLGLVLLYFLHEVALPDVLFDDLAIQWSIIIVCLFFGFIAYGMVGEQRFFNALHFLKNVSPKSKPDDIKNQFENLLSFTYSSYFLPDTGKQYRVLVVLLYADYLLSIGDETPRALNIYVQAFLQSPKDSRFRKPLLAILNQGRELTPEEMDLLLVMVQQEEIHDPTLTHYLAGLFLKAGQWSGKVEPLFLNALEDGSELSREIVQFALPIYLAHKRTDELALRFYLFALNYSVEEEEIIKNYLAHSYCEGNLAGVAPELHHKCGEVFASLSSQRQDEFKKQSDENRIASKLKRIKLFRREDLQDLKRLKVEMGLVASRMTMLMKGVSWLGQKFMMGIKLVLLQILEGLIKFGGLSLRAKLISFAVLSLSIILVLGLNELISKKSDPLLPRPSVNIAKSKPSKAKKEDRIYTVQIAAVISAKQADKMIRKLKKKGVEGLYVVKTVRRAGGHWYKIRVGQFPSKDQASAYANRLVNSKSFKNYFVISLPKK